MDLNIDVTGKEFVVTKEPEAKLDQTGAQRTTKQSGLPIWAVQVVVTDDSGGEIIRINVEAQDPPDVHKGDEVDVVGLVALPWSTNGRSGVAFRATDVLAVED